MKLLNERILKDGKVRPGNILKVDSFLNHQIDPVLMKELAQEFKRRFDGEGITKIITIEASGIAVSVLAGLEFGVPMVFAKKTSSKNLDGELYYAEVKSFTRGTVVDIQMSKKFITKDDKILIIDDFLANGQALLGLINIVKQAGATLAGCGIVIEKAFQDGGKIVRDLGVRVESLAIVESMSDDGLVLKD